LNKLSEYGWNSYFEAMFEEFSGKEFLPARISVEHRNYYELYSDDGKLKAEKASNIFTKLNEIPSVGDWAAVSKTGSENCVRIEAILSRFNKFSRKQAGVVTEEQVMAANLDYLFVVTSLNNELNVRRLERYLTLAWDNKIKPVIILNKTDLVEDYSDILSEIESISFGTPVFAVSALKNSGIENILALLKDNKTGAVVGSSGVGKSTLINSMLSSSKMKVNELSDYKDRGKHTTTHREMILLPGGGIIIDTPGIREIQLWEGEEGLSRMFEDIEKLVLECKFSDCKHESEPGCAVREAISKGQLEEDRFKSYRKLLNEIKYFERKQDKKAQLVEKKKWKKITSEAKKKSKEKF